MWIYLSYLKRYFEEKKKVQEGVLFQIGLVSNGEHGVQFPHRDDAKYSCHVSGNW